MDIGMTEPATGGPDTSADFGICGRLSCYVDDDYDNYDDEFPPAVCWLPKGHDGMHSNGRCAWWHSGLEGEER